MKKRTLALEIIAISQIFYVFMATALAYGYIPDIIGIFFHLKTTPMYGINKPIFFMPCLLLVVYIILTLGIKFSATQLNGVDEESVKESGPMLKTILLNNIGIIGMLIASSEIQNKTVVTSIFCGYLSIWLIVPALFYLWNIFVRKGR